MPTNSKLSNRDDFSLFLSEEKIKHIYHDVHTTTQSWAIRDETSAKHCRTHFLERSIHTVVPQNSEHSGGINSALDILHVPLLRYNALEFGQALSKIS